AAALESLWPGPLSGTVVTRYGYGCPTRFIELLEAGHPVPDMAGLAATRRLFDAVSGLSQDDLVIALICGGGSALLPAPPDGLTLEHEIARNDIHLATGRLISALHVVAKHVRPYQGSRLSAVP